MTGAAFVGGEFEYDVFVSYTWVNNNENGPAGKWVSEFRQRLGAALDERLGRTGRSKFFFDLENLGKNVEFGPQIETALKKSATVVAVISKGYIESPNCREEMRCFDQLVTGPLPKSGRLYLAWYDAHDARSEWPDESLQSFRDSGPFHAWFDTGDDCEAPPLVGPGMLVIHGEQELPLLFEAIQRRGVIT